MRRQIFLLAAIITLIPAAALAAGTNVVFLSDFGQKDDSVAQCKAVLLGVNPEARIVDMTHEIEPFDIRFAAFILSESAPLWPAGTVFLAVVDPGVGTARKRVAIRSKSGHYFVGPDNGIFSVIVKRLGVDKAYYIENLSYARSSISSTFEGRDVFAPVAGWLSKDPAVLEKLGPAFGKFAGFEWTPPAIVDGDLKGAVLHVEKPYGNVWTDINREAFKKTGIATGSLLNVEISGKQIGVPLVRTFGDVAVGSLLAYFNSRGLLSFAVNRGDFSQLMPLYEGKEVLIQVTQTDLVDVSLISGEKVKLDLRYATEKNFTKKKVYQSARCMLRRDTAEALVRANELAQSSKKPFSICALDCYRPLSVQKIFWKLVPDERYVASPEKGSKHNRGMAVDVTACDSSGRELEMPTAFDDFTGKAKRGSPIKSKAAAENYKALDEVMVKAGFTPYQDEWWHYDLPGWEAAPVLDIPVKDEE
jgi:S-adenosylmethionine hydrolase/D-alanyl-D-alanine dipeptidase